MSPTRRVRFAGALGAELVGQLEMPATPVRATAVFAPCFTCPKDAKAIVRSSRALADSGLAVLRFDLTGSGESAGDFADTTVSSQGADLVAAAAFLSRELEPPSLVLGISLGGVVALESAAALPALRAVVTLNAPADTRHLDQLLRRMAPEIVSEGVGSVTLFGLTTRIGRGFLDDLGRHDPVAAAADLQRPLLVCHAPDDEVVPVAHGERLFAAAAQPKAFVAIPEARHLLLDPPHVAEWVGAIAAAWTEPFLARPTQE